MKYLIGIDLGTSAVKTVLFDEKGNEVTSSAEEYPLYQPQNGWAEQDPNQWWTACTKTLKLVLEKAKVNAKDICGLGISGQMHGLVMLNEKGEVLRNSIIWCDGRTTEECREITEKIGKEKLIEINANPALEGFTASKILWVKKHEPDIYDKCCHVLLPKDFIRYKLCGVFATDVSDASGTNLFDVANRCWSNEIITKLEINAEMLPKVYESCEVTGRVTKLASAQTGLAQGMPVAGGAGDNAAAAVGTGVVENGKAFTTIGTSGVIFSHSDKVSIDKKGRVHTFCSAVPNSWTVMSCTLSAGGSLQWFKNNFCNEEIQKAAEMQTDPYAIMDKQAKGLPIGAEKLLFLPYLMGERSPILDSSARGVFFGLSGIHTRAHMIRAVMEGVTYSLKNCLDVLAEMGVNPQQMLITGGGAKSEFWRQMLADAYNCTVITSKVKEGPALGAAILAGVAAGVYSSVQAACKELVKLGEKQQPIPQNTQEYEKYYAVYKSIYPAIKENFTMLNSLK